MLPLFRFPPEVDPSGIHIHPVFLQGEIVQLEPLTPGHVGDLSIAGSDPEIWKHLFDGEIYLQWGMPTLVFHLLECQRQGTDLPFAVVHRHHRMAIGITRYLHIDRRNRRLEIASWYAPGFHGTGVNLEAKFLLLQHAFDQLNFIRVQFDIDVHNKGSIAAVEKIGAAREAGGETAVRNAHVLFDRTHRDSELWAITDNDWRYERRKRLPEGKEERLSSVKSHLMELLQREIPSEIKTIERRIAAFESLKTWAAQQQEKFMRDLANRQLHTIQDDPL